MGLGNVFRRIVPGIVALLVTAPAAAVDELPFERTEEREACSAFDPLKQPFFGDTHVHTAFSFDAASQSTRTTPRDAYRFARGATIPLQPYDAEGKALRSVTIDRPLDWTAVSDHAEMLGEVRACLVEGSPGYDSDACWFQRALGPGGLVMGQRLLLERNRFKFCGENNDVCRGNAQQVWREIQEAAEEAYDRSAACEFTTFAGYEWTGSIGRGENLHRNVIFRNHKVPDYALSFVETPSAYQLWKGLENSCIEGIDGCDVLSIPHNSNISGDGLMFASGKLESAADKELPVDVEEARRRQRYEPLVEIMQHKGDSECLLGGDTVDEACGFEKLDYNSFAGVARVSSLGGPSFEVPGPSPKAFVREALKKGIAIEAEIGVNPLKYGIIASTDTHLAAPGLVMEYDSKGHGGAGVNAALEMPVGLPDNIEFNPGGLAVAWAEENSRDSIFNALLRKETYGTSGPRMVVRFFGGWELGQGLCHADDLVERGYAEGVPMGSDLPARPDGAQAPVFAISALADAGVPEHPGTPLQRIQIVKGWVEDGHTRERVIDVAGGDNGATVDVRTCETSGAGEPRLCSVWSDPDFDPAQGAFYYARVLENPTCRWSQQMCVEAGVVCSDPETIGPGFEPCCEPDHVPVIQERAWTSPIWYRP